MLCKGTTDPNDAPHLLTVELPAEFDVQYLIQGTSAYNYITSGIQGTWHFCCATDFNVAALSNHSFKSLVVSYGLPFLFFSVIIFCNSFLWKNKLEN